MARLNLTQAMEIEDLRGKSRQQLMDILAPIRDAANKRLNRLAEKGQTNAPAYQAAMETGGKIYGSKYNSIPDLMNEIRRGQAIIKYKTSTVTGAKSYQKRMTGIIPKGLFGEGVNVPTYGEMTDEQIGKYWKILDKLGELGQTGLSTEMYNSMKALIRQSVQSDDDSIINNLMNTLPAASHEYIEEHVAAQGGYGKDQIENIANTLNAYLEWRTEYGYLGQTNTEEEEEEGDYVWL